MNARGKEYMNRFKRLLCKLFCKSAAKTATRSPRNFLDDGGDFDEDDEFDMRYPGAREFHEDCGDR